MPSERPSCRDIKIERLGEKLQAIRERAGLTLDQMADELGRDEQSRRARVYEWEANRRIPDLTTILCYARFAGVLVDILLDDGRDLPPLEDSK
jgi:transcriptional regulator with XRE-family HTH domain